MNRGMYLRDVPPGCTASVSAGTRERRAMGTAGFGADGAARGAGPRAGRADVARLSSPGVTSAAMDGYAIARRHRNRPATAHRWSSTLGDAAVYVDTGDPLPLWQMASRRSKSLRFSPERIRLRSPIAPWTHLRPVAEDIAAGDLGSPSGHRLRPVDLGALASSGATTVPVWRQPRVAVLPTGDELIPFGATPRPDEIIESNSLVLAGQVDGVGRHRHPLAHRTGRVRGASSGGAGGSRQHDLVLVNAGSSAGSEDFTAQVVESIARCLCTGSPSVPVTRSSSG